MSNKRQVFKVQLDKTGETVLISNRNRSIVVKDDTSRYTKDFIERLRRKGRAYVIMRVYPDRLRFLGYTGDKDW